MKVIIIKINDVHNIITIFFYNILASMTANRVIVDTTIQLFVFRYNQLIIMKLILFTSWCVCYRNDLFYDILFWNDYSITITINNDEDY